MLNISNDATLDHIYLLFFRLRKTSRVCGPNRIFEISHEILLDRFEPGGTRANHFTRSSLVHSSMPFGPYCL